LRIECVKKYCSIPSWMENSADGQACRREIRDAINNRRHRRSIAPLPITRAFATRVINPSTRSSAASSLSEPLSELPHAPSTSFNLDDDLNYILHFSNGSSFSQDFSTQSAVDNSGFQSFNSLPDLSHHALYGGGGGGNSFSTDTSWMSQADTVESPDVVLFPYIGTPGGSGAADYQTSSAPIPPPPPAIPSDYPTPPQNDTQVFIDNMRVYLRRIGYDIIPLAP